jgi:hypothetical protein
MREERQTNCTWLITIGALSISAYGGIGRCGDMDLQEHGCLSGLQKENDDQRSDKLQDQRPIQSRCLLLSRLGRAWKDLGRSQYALTFDGLGDIMILVVRVRLVGGVGGKL